MCFYPWHCLSISLSCSIQQSLTVLVPRVWPFLHHTISSVRKAALETLFTLLSTQDQVRIRVISVLLWCILECAWSYDILVSEFFNMADSNSARYVEAHISVLYLRKQPRNSGSYSQGICVTYHLALVLVSCSFKSSVLLCRWRNVLIWNTSQFPCVMLYCRANEFSCSFSACVWSYVDHVQICHDFCCGSFLRCGWSC